MVQSMNVCQLSLTQKVGYRKQKYLIITDLPQNISWNIEYPFALVKDTSVRIINLFFVKDTSGIFSVLFQF